MRSSAPNPFGTSLIDLLVGALAIVAMLWVLSASNTGYTGSGDEERTSGSFSVEQYGGPNFTSIRIRHGSWWEAQIDIPILTSGFQLNDGAPMTHVDRAGGLVFDNNDPKRFLYMLPDPDFDDPTTVSVVLASPGGDFRYGLHIVVQNLSGPRLEVDFHIIPFCRYDRLSFLETTVRSGNGDRKEVRFWHEAGMLQRALDRNHDRIAHRWHQTLEAHLLHGTPVRTHTFHLDPNIQFYSSQFSYDDCYRIQMERGSAGDAPGILRVRFEPDGDVRVMATDSNEVGESSASREPEYVSLMSRMDTLIGTLPTRFFDNAPPQP